VLNDQPTKSSRTRHFANYAISRTPARNQAMVRFGKAMALCMRTKQ
jgi:hypothetical protein